MGQLKETGPSALFCPGKGPLLIAEQLAFQQVLRKRRDVDGHKGSLRPAAGLVDSVGEELLSRAGLPDQKDGAFAAGHAGQRLFGFADGPGLPDDVGKAVFGVVSFVEELVSQLALPGLHIVEPLEQGEGSDARVLPDNGNHLHAEVHAVHLYGLDRQGLAALQTLGKGNVGEHLLAPPPLNQRGADAGHLLRAAAAGEYLALFVYAHHAVLQALH